MISITVFSFMALIITTMTASQFAAAHDQNSQETFDSQASLNSPETQRGADSAPRPPTRTKPPAKKKRNRNAKTKKPKQASTPAADLEFSKFGIYAKTAPRAKTVAARATTLPLQLNSGDRVALIGNTLLERMQWFGHFEAMLQTQHPTLQLSVRNLCWPADEVGLRPRPANYADLDQHLTHEKIDVIFAAFGFNESFAGKAGLPQFRQQLRDFVQKLKSSAFNGRTAPQVVLVSPIANEDTAQVKAASQNNARIKLYVEAMRAIALQEKVGFVDVFSDTQTAMKSPVSTITINGCHLDEKGYQVFASSLFRGAFSDEAPSFEETLRKSIVDKNEQFFRRHRPANTFYYTGGRNKSYGYLDFLPAMRNFEMMVDNRDQNIWKQAAGQLSSRVDDSKIPPLPQAKQSRGANRWMSAADELKAFRVDPRFEVNLFAGEEQFPDIVCPIQMRWDARGRLWVSCSTTYPHVYPGNRPNDKIVILEDEDGDGRADKSTVFADDLHIPLSFEFGDGGIYVSEMPHLTFLKDTDGDGKADLRRKVLTGFGTEDSHHSLHDITWTPDGDLIFRESVFHHTQVETPYGPVRQQNSGWFRFQPRTQRLTSFGTYSSTNPWGVTFDDWGQHVASHPVYAAAFHSLDPPYPTQHPRPAGLQAYSGVCGHEFVDFSTFPDELRGGFIKVRYKPTNRVEMHRWIEGEFGYEEQYIGDLLFSSNLSFIPVDLRYGPRGAMYVCDWYNPVKGHAQYSLRDDRRDRHSGRIWRITAKGKSLQQPPPIHEAPIEQLLDNLKRPEYRYRYWTKREIRSRDPQEVRAALDKWLANLTPEDSRYRHHQLEALWTYRWIGEVNTDLLRALLSCDDRKARAAATQQLRYWHSHLNDADDLLRQACNDENGVVRMEAAIAASYIGKKESLEALLDVFKHPLGGHLGYAASCALGSKNIRRHWEKDATYDVPKLLKRIARKNTLKEPAPNASQAQFDAQKNLRQVRISCRPERMLFSVKQFDVRPGQPVKIVFSNPDATDHNLVIVKPTALAEVGIAANEMAKDPRNASSDFIPREKKHLILEASPMIGPTRRTQVHVLRFNAPTEPGLYPYVCTFPGHWVVMNGVMVVAESSSAAKAMLAAAQPRIVKKWTLADFPQVHPKTDDESIAQGMQAFVKAKCNQCHVIAGHGVNLGPDLTQSIKKYRGQKLLQQILQPSLEINEKYLNQQFFLNDGRRVSGVVVKETEHAYSVATNLLTPNNLVQVSKKDVDEKIASKLSPMPSGMVDVLSKQEILDLLSFIENGGFKLPKHLEHKHQHHKSNKKSN